MRYEPRAVVSKTVVAGGLALALVACSGGSGGGAPGSAVSASTSAGPSIASVEPDSPSPSGDDGGTGAVTWAAPGKAVRGVKEASALRQDAAHPVTEDFVAFLEALMKTPAFAKQRGAENIVLLHEFRPEGWARASVNSCDGAAEVVYGLQGGSWAEVIASQGLEPCDKLAKLQVPAGLVEQCLDEAGKAVAYEG